MSVYQWIRIKDCSLHTPNDSTVNIICLKSSSRPLKWLEVTLCTELCIWTSAGCAQISSSGNTTHEAALMHLHNHKRLHCCVNIYMTWKQLKAQSRRGATLWTRTECSCSHRLKPGHECRRQRDMRFPNKSSLRHLGGWMEVELQTECKTNTRTFNPPGQETDCNPSPMWSKEIIHKTFTING